MHLSDTIEKSGRKKVAIRAVIDTSIWVSALLNPRGVHARLVKYFEEGAFHIIVSEPILNRSRIKEKFGIDESEIRELMILIGERTEHVAVSGDVDICRDKDDNMIIETAIKGNAGYLVTRDNDIKFGKEVSSFLDRYGITVLPIQKFLDVIGKS